MVRYDIIWHDMTWYGTVMVCYGTWYGIVWYGMAWHGIVYGTVWFVW